MKTIKSKKLNKRVNTVCDYNAPLLKNSYADTTTTGTDTTNTTITTLTTNTGVIAKC